MAKAQRKKKKTKAVRSAFAPASKAATPRRSGKKTPLIVGIDLGGTNMQIGVVDPKNNILAREGKKTKVDEGTAAIVQRLVSGVQTVCDQAGISPRQLTAVGIGAPGAIDPVNGVVLEAPNLRWNNMPLAKTLRQKLGVPVVLENDVNAAVFGEWKLGAGRGSDDFMGVWLGTGVGGGFVLNGRLYAGGFNTAGEIGHMMMVPGAPYGRKSVEQNCSRTAVVERLQFLIRANNKSMLTDLTAGDLTQIRSKVISQAFHAGDRLTVRVLEEAAEMIGTHIGSCVTLLSLSRIVMGGGLTEALGEPFVKLVRRAVQMQAFPNRCKDVQVLASTLEDDAGLLGAALLARQSSL